MYGIKYNCERGKLGSNRVIFDVELVLYDYWLSIYYKIKNKFYWLKLFGGKNVKNS